MFPSTGHEVLQLIDAMRGLVSLHFATDFPIHCLTRYFMMLMKMMVSLMMLRCLYT
jgi:hypothetical protein